MDRRNRPKVDGFVPRRSAGSVDSFRLGAEIGQKKQMSPGGLQRHNVEQVRSTVANQDGSSQALTPVESDEPRRQIISRADVDESLQQIDAEPEQAKKSKKARHGRHAKKPHSKRRRIIKWVIIAVLLIGFGIAAWIVGKAILAGQQVFKGDIFGIVQQKELKMDANGRSNILILGTSEDDPGHNGAFLTDSIMILSVDQKNKNAYMISIPRDLEVQYGMACTAGYSGKINGYFNCVNGDWTSTAAEDERQEKSRAFFGDIVGLDIQYSVHVNYTVMRDVVKALGGITITIESRDSRGQMDSNFDWKCGATYSLRLQNCPPSGHYIDYPNGEVTLDAEHALYLAQARGDMAPTYGFEYSNFDREKNQQKIIVAIKEKALSSGTLTNVSKVTALIDALGNNLRTNFETSEVRTLMSLASDIPSASIQSVDLLEGGVVNTSAQPTAGQFNYSEIQAYIQKIVNATPVSKEAAHVVVLNASGVTGAAQTEADKLEELGLVVDDVDNVPDGTTFKKNTFYYVGTDKPKTLAALKSRYGSSALSSAKAPVTVADTTDFVVVIYDPIAATN